MHKEKRHERENKEEEAVIRILGEPLTFKAVRRQASALTFEVQGVFSLDVTLVLQILIQSRSMMEFPKQGIRQLLAQRPLQNNVCQHAQLK
jgi:hypothetical protein